MTPREMTPTIQRILAFNSFSRKAAETRRTETGVKALILYRRRSLLSAGIELVEKTIDVHLNEGDGKTKVDPIREDEGSGEEETDR